MKMKCFFLLLPFMLTLFSIHVQAETPPPPGPLVEIDGNLNLCDGSPTTLTVLIGIFPDPVTILWSTWETTTDIIVGTTGTICVTVTSTIDPSCFTTVCVDVINDATWHNSTSNTQGTESANDIVTDNAGNVYVVGTFTDSTYIEGGGNPDIMISPVFGTMDGCMYVAKYSPCGTLLWVANSSESARCTGASITLDEINNMVYVTGNYLQSAKFNSSQSADNLCGSGYSQTITATSSQSGYIAQYDLNTGCLYFAEEIIDGLEQDCRTITTNEFDGSIYVGGSFKTTWTGEDYVFIHKYKPETTLGTGNVLYPAAWSIMENVFASNTFGVVNDLDFHEFSSRLYAVGTFHREVHFFDGTLPATLFANPGNVSDAFLLVYNDFGSPTYADVRRGNAGPNLTMTGDGVATHMGTGRCFMIGDYDETIVDPFGLAVDGINPLLSAGRASYMIGMRVDGWMIPWARYTLAWPFSTARVDGKDVVVSGSRVNFLHDFEGTSFDVGPEGGPVFSYPFIGVSAGNSHIATVTYDFAGDFQWGNVTRSPAPSTFDDHHGHAITSDNFGQSFIAGDYHSSMSYFSGSPYSGMLSYTGVAGGYNACMLRVQNSSGAYERAGAASALEVNAIDIQFQPNPTSGIAQVSIPEFEMTNSYHMELMTPAGQVLMKQSITEATTQLDLQDLASGVYFISINDGKQKKTLKIVLAK